MITISALLAVQVWFGSYSVSDIGKAGVPALSSRQKAWIGAVRCTPAYARRWGNLRFLPAPIAGIFDGFGPAPPREIKLTVPLVVFDTNGWTPAFKAYGYFHIIGEDCRTQFNLVTHSLIGPVNGACQPNGNNRQDLPAPVIGESWFAANPAGAPARPICRRGQS